MLNSGEIHISHELVKNEDLKLLVVMGLYQIMMKGLWQL